MTFHARANVEDIAEQAWEKPDALRLGQVSGRVN